MRIHDRDSVPVSNAKAASGRLISPELSNWIKAVRLARGGMNTGLGPLPGDSTMTATLSNVQFSLDSRTSMR
jgi:hypothetical protein